MTDNTPILDRLYRNYSARLGVNDVYANIIEWLTRNYVSPKSDRARNYSVDTCPWFAPILLAAASGDYRIVSVLGAVGVGKSEFLCQFLCYALAQAPGDCALYTQTAEDARIFIKTRFAPVVRAIPALKPFLPSDQDSFRKAALICPTMSLIADGANLTSAQSKSCRYVVGDEVWMFGSGILTEILARTHSRRDGLALVVGQAGVKNDEHDNLHERTNKHEWSFTCPNCAKVHPYNFKQLAYEIARTSDGEIDRMRIKNTVHLVCPSCQAKYFENDRHKLVGVYLKQPSNALPENIGFKISAVGLPHVSWSSIAIAREEALDRMRIGDDSAMRQFKEKVEVIPWAETLVKNTKIRTTGYSIKEFADGKTRAFPDGFRLASVDFQLKFRYMIVREYDSDGKSSKLLFASELETDDEIEFVRNYFGVPAHFVFCDMGYDTTRVALLAEKYGFRLLRGSGSEFFTVHLPDKRIVIDGTPRGELPPPIKAFVSEPTTMEIQGRHFRYNYFSSAHFRDVLQHKIDNDTGFGIPDDAPLKYRQDLTSEIREIKYSTLHGPRPKWVLLPHRSNEAADCEGMLLAALAEAGVE